tara:strand:+ start:161 stop:451 length:291 start_codon:yes stop_codon:yes gene_type:complete
MMNEYWEVRENGVRYCHCGRQETAWDLVRMKPGVRTCHKITPLAGTTIDVVATETLELPGQLGLPYTPDYKMKEYDRVLRADDSEPLHLYEEAFFD